MAHEIADRRKVNKESHSARTTAWLLEDPGTL
jgi:hypothetical protein